MTMLPGLSELVHDYARNEFRPSTMSSNAKLTVLERFVTIGNMEEHWRRSGGSVGTMYGAEMILRVLGVPFAE